MEIAERATGAANSLPHQLIHEEPHCAPSIVSGQIC